MIEYANELIKEIENNHPTNATTITVCGVPIKDVRYDGTGLNISCESLDFIDKRIYDDLKEDFGFLEDELEGERERNDAFLDCLEEVRNLIEECEKHPSEIEDNLDKIYNKIEEML